jgi:single-strand DNA-binding protein
MDLNEVNLLGRATRDAELKNTPDGTAVATVSIATGKKFKRENETVEQTQFHNIVFWKKLAEIAGQYLTKGKRVYIKGELVTRSWEDKETGKKMYRTEIVAKEMILLDGGSEKKDDFSESDKKHGIAQKDVKEEITVEDLPF